MNLQYCLSKSERVYKQKVNFVNLEKERQKEKERESEITTIYNHILSEKRRHIFGAEIINPFLQACRKCKAHR